MSTKEKFELSKVLYDSQVKFMYYVIGLNVAAIGFTIAKTFENSPKELNHIFLGLALLSWIVSILLAFKWIFIQFRAMVRNLDHIELMKRESIPFNLRKQKISHIRNDLDKLTYEGEWSMKMTFTLFVSGVIFFIFWRIFIVFNLQL